MAFQLGILEELFSVFATENVIELRLFSPTSLMGEEGRNPETRAVRQTWEGCIWSFILFLGSREEVLWHPQFSTSSGSFKSKTRHKRERLQRCP